MLKCKPIWTCLALMITLLSGSSLTTYAEPITGYFDQMEGGSIVGWGWEPTSPNTAVPVRITITDEQTSQVVRDFHPTAAIHRTDLESSHIGNGSHGFSVHMDWDSLPDGVYRIEGWANGKKFANTQTYVKGEQPRETPTPDVAQGQDGTNANPALAAETVSIVKSLGSFRTTGYCPCSRCNGKWGGLTSTGAIPRSSHTIAVDPRVIPYGTRVMINGVVYTAEDCGGGVKGNHIDVFYDTHSQALQHGLRSQEVFLLR